MTRLLRNFTGLIAALALASLFQTTGTAAQTSQFIPTVAVVNNCSVDSDGNEVDCEWLDGITVLARDGDGNLVDSCTTAVGWMEGGVTAAFCGIGIPRGTTAFISLDSSTVPSRYAADPSVIQFDAPDVVWDGPAETGAAFVNTRPADDGVSELPDTGTGTATIQSAPAIHWTILAAALLSVDASWCLRPNQRSE